MKQPDDTPRSKPNELTTDWALSRDGIYAGDAEAPVLPTRIDRYEIQAVLGKGGFGVVYKAIDTQLDRQVALKVPRPDRFKTRAHMDRFIDEARSAARLKHPSLVAVYDVQQHDGRPFIVQELIDGPNLGEWIARHRPPLRDVVPVLVGITEAIDSAHQQGLIHCDLKLANVLMDEDGAPHVADFGLAIHEDVLRFRKGEIFGTPGMMAPEQVRGESHRIDGRTDVWAVGVMLYQLLVDRRPFEGDSAKEMFDEILVHDPKPPRQIDRSVPKELERICLKCLSKRRSDRYNTMDDLRDDLDSWLKTVEGADLSSDRAIPGNVVPKGLRAFDELDASFFLSLLPGPYDQDGLPESIRFWKNRIEETDGDKTFSVGLIYGPSGCGKSSLVQAGLIPQLADHIIPVYVEATSEETERRLIRRLSKRFPALSDSDSLAEAISALRKGADLTDGAKVLVVIDQFEQWLHGRSTADSASLTSALRHCDGESVQCIVLVRDDFWMGVSRFMQELEVRIVEGVNANSVDLFSVKHATEVLQKFGQAYGALGRDLSVDEQQFLTRSVLGLATDNQVISVRLALFAQLMKNRPWTQNSLRNVGGTEGVGVTFLEETFCASNASPEHRHHQLAARRVLSSLLPPLGTDIKGHMRPMEDIRQTSGYGSRPRDFSILINILDRELRLVTPTTPEGSASDDDELPIQVHDRYYQLTHDYLVPPLRQWLTRKQRETWRGRTELRLSTLAESWSQQSENRHLPSIWEALLIVGLTRRRAWTDRQRHMMAAATKYHSKRWGVLIALLTISVVASFHYVGNQRRLRHRARAEGLVSTLINARADGIPYILPDLDSYADASKAALLENFEKHQLGTQSRLRVAYGLARFELTPIVFVVSNIHVVPAEESTYFMSALRRNRRQAIAQMKKNISPEMNTRTKARLAISLLSLGDLQFATQMLSFKSDPIERTIFIAEFETWFCNPDVAIETYRSARDSQVRSGLCLSLGHLSECQRLSDEQRFEIVDTLKRHFLVAPDAGTHAAADWALRRFGESLPLLPTTSRASPEMDWYVNSLGMTFVRVDPGEFTRHHERTGDRQRVIVTKPFFLADREVTFEQFQKFLTSGDESNIPTGWNATGQEFNAQPNWPVQKTNWFDAAMFCNWLSYQENRKPCYESILRDGKRFWVGDFSADGYRLPTEAEWELACRAGTGTNYSCGDDTTYLHRYAVFRTSPSESVATRLPNDFGLFDMHGNVWEWMHDHYEPRYFFHPPFLKTETVRDLAGKSTPRGPAGELDNDREDGVLRSGAYKNQERFLRSAQRIATYSANRAVDFGFRPARNASH